MKKLNLENFKKLEIKKDSLKKIQGGNTSYSGGNDYSNGDATYMDDGRCFCNDELVVRDNWDC